MAEASSLTAIDTTLDTLADALELAGFTKLPTDTAVVFADMIGDVLSAFRDENLQVAA